MRHCLVLVLIVLFFAAIYALKNTCYLLDDSGAAVSVLHTMTNWKQHFTENLQHSKYYLPASRSTDVLCLALSLVKHQLAQLCIEHVYWDLYVIFHSL